MVWLCQNDPMDLQTSTDYNVDNRYRGVKSASDNQEGKHFLNKFIDQRKQANETNLTQERKEDNRFVVSAPGLGVNYSFKNAFNAPRSPAQRRLEREA